jgi:hypothetical protein
MTAGSLQDHLRQVRSYKKNRWDSGICWMLKQELGLEPLVAVEEMQHAVYRAFRLMLLPGECL